MNPVQENIEKFKKVLQIAGAAAVLSLACIIMVNTFIPDNKNLTHDDYLKHFLNDHEVNRVNFQFIKFDISNKYYFETKSSQDINTVAAVSIFLVFSIIIFIDLPKANLLYAEKFLSCLGFRHQIFRPPKFTS